MWLLLSVVLVWVESIVYSRFEYTRRGKKLVSMPMPCTSSLPDGLLSSVTFDVKQNQLGDLKIRVLARLILLVRLWWAHDSCIAGSYLNHFRWVLTCEWRHSSVFHSGISESEQFLKGTSQIKILSADDIEGMRVVSKVTKLMLSSCHSFVMVARVSFPSNSFWFVVSCSWHEKSSISQPWW